MPNETWHYTSDNNSFLINLLKEKSYSAVVYQDSYAPTEQIVINACKNSNIPLYVFEHNSPLFVNNKRKLDNILSLKGLLRRILHPYLLYADIKRKRYLFNNCEKYILLSKPYISEFASLTGISATNPKLTYIHNPITTSYKVENITKENIICCVCQLNKVKRVDEMLRVWKRIQTQLYNWRFQIVGDGEEREHLEALAQKLRLERIDFVGFSNPTKYYNKAKIFLMTSKYEGLPMTILEAVQHKCVPIVYDSFSSIHDIIENNFNGIIIKNNDTDSFSKAIINLATDESKREDLAKNGTSLLNDFKLSSVLNRWIDLLK